MILFLSWLYVQFHIEIEWEREGEKELERDKKDRIFIKGLLGIHCHEKLVIFLQTFFSRHTGPLSKTPTWQLLPLLGTFG